MATQYSRHIAVTAGERSRNACHKDLGPPTVITPAASGPGDTGGQAVVPDGLPSNRVVGTRRRRMNRKVMLAMMLAVAVMFPFAGCAGKARLSAAKMCVGAGGKYNAQTQTCDAPAMSGRKASDMCQAHGGYYDPTAQTCEVGLE
jgi:hypothetical protein